VTVFPTVCASQGVDFIKINVTSSGLLIRGSGVRAPDDPSLKSMSYMIYFLRVKFKSYLCATFGDLLLSLHLAFSELCHL